MGQTVKLQGPEELLITFPMCFFAMVEIHLYKCPYKGKEICGIVEYFPNTRCIPMYLVHVRLMSSH